MSDSTTHELALLGHKLEVSAVSRETADAVSITFEIPAELDITFSHRAGQFITVAVPSERVPHVARCYSLSSPPGGGTTITVKRVEGGYASDWLNRNVAQGASLRVLPPSGSFTVPDSSADILLAAAGSGITPVMSILRWMLQSGDGRVALFYANRDRESTIFADELDRLAHEHPDRLSVSHWFEDGRGLPTAEALAQWADDHHDGDVWTCGPAPFMEVVASAVTPNRRLHREEYRSLTTDPFAPEPSLSDTGEPGDEETADVEVELDGETHHLAWPRSKNLVEVLLEHGIQAPHACREGWCGSCTAHLDKGEVTMTTSEGLDPDDESDGYVLGCQALPVTDNLKVTFD
ncbi:2Fe-2S iron-sulfur cluster-binding protein [Rhodococcus aetherivorans]